MTGPSSAARALPGTAGARSAASSAAKDQKQKRMRAILLERSPRVKATQGVPRVELERRRAPPPAANALAQATPPGVRREVQGERGSTGTVIPVHDFCLRRSEGGSRPSLRRRGWPSSGGASGLDRSSPLKRENRPGAASLSPGALRVRPNPDGPGAAFPGSARIGGRLPRRSRAPFSPSISAVGRVGRYVGRAGASIALR